MKEVFKGAFEGGFIFLFLPLSVNHCKASVLKFSFTKMVKEVRKLISQLNFQFPPWEHVELKDQIKDYFIIGK
jgi:hypothetical protein